MEYMEFVEYVRAAMATILGDDKIVTVKKILKNNGQEYEALLISDNNSNISPTIYLNSFYDEYENGKEGGEVVKEIYEFYENNCDEFVFDMDVFSDYSIMSKKIVFKVINKAKNKRLLKDVPHITRMDLALVPYCMVDSDCFGNATVLIQKTHLALWNKTEKEIFEAAFYNTPRILAPEIRNMNDIIREMFMDDLRRRQINGEIDIDLDVEERTIELMQDLGTDNGIEMFVLTNNHRLNGAACMFYEKVLKEFADSRKSDIFILPSSIHEVILVPAVEGLSKNELTLMVQDVNREELSPEEILSSHVYVYNYVSEEIEM